LKKIRLRRAPYRGLRRPAARGREYVKISDNSNHQTCRGPVFGIGAIPNRPVFGIGAIPNRPVFGIGAIPNLVTGPYKICEIPNLVTGP